LYRRSLHFIKRYSWCRNADIPTDQPDKPALYIDLYSPTCGSKETTIHYTALL